MKGNKIMKQLSSAFLVLVCMLLLSSVGYSSVNSVSNTNSTQTLDKAEIRERFLSRTGGFIPNKKDARGCIAIINAQKNLSEQFIRSRAEKIEAQLWLRVSYFASNVTVSMLNLKSIAKSGGGNVSVIVIEDHGLPALIHLPEERVAVVNIAPLAKGVLKREQMEKRVSQELSRAVAFVLGLGYSKIPGGIMSPLQSIEDLDGVMTDLLPADIAINADFSAANFGITRFTRNTYRKACQEGWAPLPKNKYQKKIYDEVYRIPDSPLQIKYKASEKK